MGKKSPKKGTPQHKKEETKDKAPKEDKKTKDEETTADAQLVKKDVEKTMKESAGAPCPDDKPIDKTEMLRRMFDANAIATSDPHSRVTETRSADGKKYACIISPAVDPKSKYGKVFLELMNMLESELYVSEYEKALATFAILEYHVTGDKWKTAQELVDTILNLNREILAKYADETTPENVIRRMRKIIVDEYVAQATLKKIEFQHSGVILKDISHRNVVIEDIPELAPDCDPEEVARKMKKPLIFAMKEYKTELDNVPTIFAKLAPNYVNEGDNIFTYSFDPNICAMLVAQAEKGVNLNLYVVETAPACHSYLYVDELEDYPNAVVTIISDACIDQAASKVNKVLLPCNALAPSHMIKTITTGYNFTLFTGGIDTVLVACNFQLSSTDNIQTNKMYKCNDIDCFKYDILDRVMDNVRIVLTNTGTIGTSQIDEAIHDLYTPKKEKEEAYVVEKVGK